MTPFSPIVDVEHLASRDTTMRRVAGLLDDNRTLVVATMRAGSERAEAEFSLTIDEALALAEACLAGNQRALTTPGLARKLSATLAVLFRVCRQNGGIQEIFSGEDADGGRYSGDRDEAAGVEGADE